MERSNPQRALGLQRPTTRFANSAEHQAMLAARLTTRDRWLARMVAEHRVLTSRQIARIAFGNVRSANRRLLELYRWRVLDRFHPYTPVGDTPRHYVLDTAGATVLAVEDGIESKRLGYRHADAMNVAHSLQLDHVVGVNGFFCDLIAHSREHEVDGEGLVSWWPEARCARHFGRIVRPDAYGRWRHDQQAIEFFLEYDRGTENLSRLAGKLSDYERLATATTIVTPILFILPTPQREDSAARVLTDALRRLDNPDRVPLATTHQQAGATSAGLRWHPLIPNQLRRQRHTLAGLATAWPHLQQPTTTTGPASGEPHASSSGTGGRLRPPVPLPPPIGLSLPVGRRVAA